MVQSLNQKNTTLSRIGQSQDGRVIFQLSDKEGNPAAAISVAATQADIFEKSYSTIERTSPKMEEYMKKMSDPILSKSENKKTKMITLASALTGFLIPAIAIKKDFAGKFSTLLKGLISTAGLALGLFAGIKINTSRIPKEVKEFTAATRAMSNLDVQPLQ